MPDISGFQALDVAIGLAFLYFVFSLLASGVNEAIASVFALRARFLERGLRSMLEHPGERGKLLGQVENHPLVRSLVRDANTVADTSKLKKRWKPWRQPLPSYLPSRTFSLALLDTLAPPDDARDRRDALQRLRGALEEPKSDAVKLLPEDARKTLESLVVDAGRDRDQLRISMLNRLTRLRATGPPEGGPRDRRPRSPRLSTEGAA